MDYKELSRIGGDPALVRNTASMIKQLLGPRITEWQDQFLSDMEAFKGPDRLSTRRCEALVSLRNQAFRRSTVGGYKASNLIRKIFEARLDLSEEDEEFIVSLQDRGSDAALSDPEWKHVFGLCRQLQLIESAYIPLH